MLFIDHFRKGSKTNEPKSVLNSIKYKKSCNSDDLRQLEVKEYSEIQEHFKVRLRFQIHSHVVFIFWWFGILLLSLLKDAYELLEINF